MRRSDLRKVISVLWSCCDGFYEKPCQNVRFICNFSSLLLSDCFATPISLDFSFFQQTCKYRARFEIPIHITSVLPHSLTVSLKNVWFRAIQVVFGAFSKRVANSFVCGNNNILLAISISNTGTTRMSILTSNQT